jgi:hypothetical protein
MVGADTAERSPSRIPGGGPDGLCRSCGAGASWTRARPAERAVVLLSQVGWIPAILSRCRSTPHLFSADGGRHAVIPPGLHVDTHAGSIDDELPGRGQRRRSGVTAYAAATGSSEHDSVRRILNVSYDMACRVCGGLGQIVVRPGGGAPGSTTATGTTWAAATGSSPGPDRPDIVYAESRAATQRAWPPARWSLAKPQWRTQYASQQDSIHHRAGDTTTRAGR